MKIISKLFSFDEFNDFIFDFNLYEYKLKSDKHNSFNGFEGFRYFSPSCLHHGNNKEKILVAFKDSEKAENIIGLIWYGDYGYSNNHQAVSFIDVKENYRNQGVATFLIKELNQHLCCEQPLYLSRLSNDGQKYHIDKLFERFITATSIIKEE